MKTFFCTHHPRAFDERICDDKDKTFRFMPVKLFVADLTQKALHAQFSEKHSNSFQLLTLLCHQLSTGGLIHLCECISMAYSHVAGFSCDHSCPPLAKFGAEFQ